MNQLRKIKTLNNKRRAGFIYRNTVGSYTSNDKSSRAAESDAKLFDTIFTQFEEHEKLKKKGQVCSKSTSSQQQLPTPRDFQSTDHLIDEHYETVETPPRIPNSARRSLDEPFSNTFDTIEESKNV